MTVPRAMAAAVFERAGGRCEYCRVPDGVHLKPFEIDHVRALRHDGRTEPANLALSCHFCNSAQGTNLASIDPQTGEITRLFNPRRDRWTDEFGYDAGVISGRTAAGRTTVFLLRMNEPSHVAVRRLLADDGLADFTA